MATLGTGDYEVSIVFSANPSQTIAVLPWSSLKWQRTKNQASSAEFTVSGFDGGIDCAKTFGGLRPWDHMMVIERNGYTVWDGPITGWSTDEDGGVTIRGYDRSIIFSKTLIGATKRWAAGAAELETILVAILNDANLSRAPFPLTIDADVETYFNPPRPAEVDLHVERLDTVAATFEQIGQSTDLFWTCRNDFISFCEHKVRGGLTPEGIAGSYALGYDNNWLALSEAVVLTRPKVTVDAMNLATDVYLGGASTGSNGHAIIAHEDLRTALWYLANGDPPPYILSTLQGGDANLSQADNASVNSAAEQLAVEVSTPNLAIEQLRLAPSFGGRALLPSLDNLLPGTRFSLAFEETAAFLVPASRRVWNYVPTAGTYTFSLAWAGDTTHVRMDQLDVEVDADGVESIMGSFVSTVEVLSALVNYTSPADGSITQRRVVY